MDNNIKLNVAINLSELRKRHGYTQSDVAKEINYSDKAISKWENGDSLPDLVTLCALADLYGVTVDFLTKDNDEKKLDEVTKADMESRNSPTKIIILLMSLTVVWLIATIVFSYTVVFRPKAMWQVFVWAIPACCVIILYFNSHWYKNGKLRLVTLSILCWTLLTSIFLQFMNYSLWPIFILGVPLQIIICLGNIYLRR